MATPKRIYVVSHGDGTDDKPKIERLVRAVNPAQAIRHVTSPMYEADVASQDDLIRLAKSTTVEEAGESE